MVVDTSVLLAVLFREELAEWCVRQLEENVAFLRMSTVNLAETLIRLRDRHPKRADALQDEILGSAIKFVAPDVEQARLAAEARLRYPLNLGDCFAYALAAQEKCAVLTLDRDFLSTDAQLVIPGRGVE